MELEEIRIPVVAIGGITLRRAPEVLAAGADSVAVIRDVSSDPDPERRARAYLEQLGGADYPRRGVLFLTGFMGTGKSAVGRSLAGRLSRRFVDLDAWIEERVGMTVPKIFARRGEAAFREAEAEALRSIPRGGDAIVALGGGTLLRLANRERVRERGVLVWLDAPLDEALRRCGSGSERPLLGRGAAADLYAARLPGYRSAPVRVSTAGRSVEEATHDVLRHVHREKHGI